jgi:hypothetical protein
MTQLARKLRVVDYFTLGWGTMVGVGWLVVMDDWLGPRRPRSNLMSLNREAGSEDRRPGTAP